MDIPKYLQIENELKKDWRARYGRKTEHKWPQA